MSLSVYRKALVIFVFCLCASPPALAASSSNEGTVNLKDSQINELISTLESETARNELISNLKVMVEANDHDDLASLSLSDALHINDTSSTLMHGYANLAKATGLDGSLFTKSLLLLIVVLAALLIIFTNNRISTALNRSSNRVRNQFELSQSRFNSLFYGQRLAGYATAAFIVFYTSASILTSPSDSLRFPGWGLTLANYVVIALLLALMATIVWELLNAALEYAMSSKSNLNSARVETLLPVLRNIILSILVVLVFIISLSEAGIDILPLLAGAGVLGIAVGFGAQTIVKDFIAGFAVILEDLIQVDDVVGIAGRIGRVEKITLRKIQLRSLDGTVHTIPHSELTVIDNLTKEFTYYMLNIGVAYGENVDEVIECLIAVDDDLRNDAEFSDMILEPLDVLGLDEFGDSAVIIKARTKTKAHDKWTVGREFNKRIKKAFDEQGIEIPFPHRTVYFGASAEPEEAEPA